MSRRSHAPQGKNGALRMRRSLYVCGTTHSMHDDAQKDVRNAPSVRTETTKPTFC